MLALRVKKYDNCNAIHYEVISFIESNGDQFYETVALFYDEVDALYGIAILADLYKTEWYISDELIDSGLFCSVIKDLIDEKNSKFECTLIKSLRLDHFKEDRLKKVRERSSALSRFTS